MLSNSCLRVEQFSLTYRHSYCPRWNKQPYFRVLGKVSLKAEIAAYSKSHIEKVGPIWKSVTNRSKKNDYNAPNPCIRKVHILMEYNSDPVFRLE